jgi:sulfur-oxidizing protein SoxY
MKRRLFLKGTLATSAVVTAVSAGLLSPTNVLANVTSFKAKNTAAINTANSAAEGDFKFKAPEIAENGAVVPLTIDARKMSGVEEMSIVVEKSSTPLSASFNIAAASGYVSTRIKMGKSSKVTALVKANGQWFKKSQEVKVTIGGCGG